MAPVRPDTGRHLGTVPPADSGAGTGPATDSGAETAPPVDPDPDTGLPTDRGAGTASPTDPGAGTASPTDSDDDPVLPTDPVVETVSPTDPGADTVPPADPGTRRAPSAGVMAATAGAVFVPFVPFVPVPVTVRTVADAGPRLASTAWPAQTRMPEVPPILADLVESPLVYAAVVLVVGVVVGYSLGRLSVRVLNALDVPEGVEGTPFERTAQSLGTSTVGIVARLSSWFVYAVTVLAAVNIAGLVDTQAFWQRLTGFVPQLFIAAFVLVVGFVVADKAELLVGEYLRGVKVPEIGLAPRLVKYSVLYVAGLVALSQVGVRTLALVALLTVYAFALVLFAGLAFKDFLSSAAAGVYLILNQPYGIGDEVRIGDRHGVVQGMDMFVTRIENDEQEYIVPNRLVLEEGVARTRD